MRNANALLLRELPYSHLDDTEEEQGRWWDDFLEACAMSEENCTVLEYLEPTWEAVVGKKKEKTVL